MRPLLLTLVAPAALLAGCDIPMLNEPPYLVSANDADAGGGPNGRQANTEQYVPVSLPPLEGDVLDLTLIAEDPDGDPFEIWLPMNLGTVDFDPSGTTGRWILPGPDPQGRQPPLALHVVVRDPEHEEAATWYILTFDGQDTGGDTATER